MYKRQVKTPDDARRLLETGACAGVVLKIAKSGLSGTLAIARAVSDAGGRCLFGCMMETRIGIAAALHLALALGASVVPDLDLDGHLLVNDGSLAQGNGLRPDRDMRHARRARPAGPRCTPSSRLSGCLSGVPLAAVFGLARAGAHAPWPLALAANNLFLPVAAALVGAGIGRVIRHPNTLIAAAGFAVFFDIVQVLSLIHI